MTSPPTVVIVGAGIGGLTAALALAQRGFAVSVVEQAEQLEAIGAGIQLSPNAARVLIDLGLGERLAPRIVAPNALNVMNARSGRVLARALLGDAATRRYGAPYWVIHRGDLHTVLREAIEATPLISLQLGLRIDDIAIEDTGVTVSGHKDQQPAKAHGGVLIGADGLWSQVRERLGHGAPLQFAGHTAWRTLIPAEALSPAMRAPSVNLWLGRDTHLVHYPVRGGSVVNVVAIVRDHWREPGWSAAGERDEILARFPAGLWHTARARTDRRRRSMAEMGALRLPPVQKLGRRTGDAVGRRRASDAALPGARRGDGDRGRRGAGVVSRADAWRRTGRAARLRAQAPQPHRPHPARRPPQRHGLSYGRRSSGPAQHGPAGDARQRIAAALRLAVSVEPGLISAYL